MTYIQKLTPPPNRVLSFSLRDFVGGLNNRSEQLQVNEASDVLNMMFADDTVMEKRKGQEYFDEVTINGTVNFIDEFKPYNDLDILIRGTNSSIRFGASESIPIINKPCGVNHQGNYIFVDGEKIYVYGKFPQTTSTHEVIVGTPINNYTLMEITSPPDGHARLGTSHKQGVTRYNYTTMAIWYEPCENEFVDVYMGANKIPENPKYIVSHNGRLFLSGSDKDDDNVFISDIKNPYYFPVTLPIQIPPNSDKVAGLIVYDNSVVIGRKDDIYVIYGDTNRPNFGFDVFRLRKLNSHCGIASNDAACIAHNFMFFLGSDGNAYSLSSTRNDEKILSTTLLTRKISLNSSPIDIDLGLSLSTSCSVFFNDEWYVSVGDKVLVYSYRHKSWTLYNNINARYFYNLNGVMIWGKEDGRIAKFSNNYFDFGKPFKAIWASKYFDMDDANTFKQFREFFLVVHTFADVQSDIYVNFQIDYFDVQSSVVISNEVAIFGKTRWGARFINRNIVHSLPFVIGRRGRAIKFILTCGHFIESTVFDIRELNLHPKKNEILVYVESEDKYYISDGFKWIETPYSYLNQTMKIYQINGDYELRGKR